eukprot:Sro190_g081840.1 n/a (270) ;mRNA; r:42602-43808
MTFNNLPLVIACLALLVVQCTAFTVSPSALSRGATTSIPRPLVAPLFAEEGEETEQDGDADGEAAAEEEEAEQEDPEVKALKDEIADLEKTLKEKKSQIQYLSDQTDTYSKAGYARKVAEMENMRRMRSSMASSNQETSVATVLRNFLPVKDILDKLQDKHSQDEFGKQYGALAGNFNTAMTQLGVSEYTATEGEPVDRTRYLVVEEELSPDVTESTVLRTLKNGLELKGNVVRLAEVVAKIKLEEEAEEEPAAEETAEAAAEGAEASE